MSIACYCYFLYRDFLAWYVNVMIHHSNAFIRSLLLVTCYSVQMHFSFSLQFNAGLFSRGSGGIMGFHGSPEASFVSVQTYKNSNASPSISPGGSTVSSSPKYEYFSLFLLCYAI